MLARFLGDRRPLAVAVQEGSAPDLPTPRMGPASMAHPPWMAPGAGMHFGSQAGVSFVAQVRLADGMLLTFDSRQPAESASWPYRLLLSLAIVSSSRSIAWKARAAGTPEERVRGSELQDVGRLSGQSRGKVSMASRPPLPRLRSLSAPPCSCAIYHPSYRRLA
jgi:hypothetical protein